MSSDLFSGFGKSRLSPPCKKGSYWKGALTEINFYVFFSGLLPEFLGCKQKLGGRFGYFLFFLLGEGKGESRCRGWVGLFFLLKIPGGGEGFRRGEGPGGCLQRIGEFVFGGGDLNFFFRGRNVHQESGRPSKWPPECLPSKFADFECAFSLQFLGEKMTPKDPFLEGTFWDKFWRPIRSRALCSLPNFHGTVVSQNYYPRNFIFIFPN